MSINIGVIMDPIANISYKKDSTLAMLWAAAARGWNLFYMEVGDLYLTQGQARARCKALQVAQDPARWYQLQTSQDIALQELDVILMRKDPPFNMRFIYATYVLDRAEQAGVLIINRPASLRDCNEKLYATQFLQCCTPTLVATDKQVLREFVMAHQEVVLKPLDGMGGASIFRTRHDDVNLSVIIETLTEHGDIPAMAQQYIPAISAGDKRILLIDGEPVPFCLARIPAAGESRGNLAAGGRGEVRALSERDRWICAQLRDSLMEKGLVFVGIDVIGDYLTEINVTSPTCIREIHADSGINAAELLLDSVANKLETRV
jgi:glutathione synthase